MPEDGGVGFLDDYVAYTHSALCFLCTCVPACGEQKNPYTKTTQIPRD